MGSSISTLAQGSLKRYQIVKSRLSSARQSTQGWSVLSERCHLDHHARNDHHFQLHRRAIVHRRAILIPLWCFVRDSSPRPWVSKEIPDDLHNPVHRRTIRIPLWCFVRVGSPRPGVSKEIPDCHNEITSSSIISSGRVSPDSALQPCQPRAA